MSSVNDNYSCFVHRETLLYTEMVNDAALVHNPEKLEDFIDFDETIEPPLALQLGGNDPATLGRAVELAEYYKGGHFSEINLNCGCPSNKAKKAGYGAELMLEPDLVRQIVYEMNRRSSNTEITVKCRIGTSKKHSWEDLVEFVEACKQGGVKKMIVHSRICMLNGLSPAQNRTVPPLKYEVTHRLVDAFPDMTFVLNGGIKSFEEADAHMGRAVVAVADYYCGGYGSGAGCGYVAYQAGNSCGVSDICADAADSLNGCGGDVMGGGDGETACGDAERRGKREEVPIWQAMKPVHGIMIGREAYGNPWLLANADHYYYQRPNPGLSRREVLEAYLAYCSRAQDNGEFKSSAAVLCRPLHNFFTSCGGHYNRLYKRCFDRLIKERANHSSVNTREFRIDELVWDAVHECIPDGYLDERMGPEGVMIAS
jgi:tRNA-dihydrouridine synthase